jgi:hypothetical protein
MKTKSLIHLLTAALLAAPSAHAAFTIIATDTVDAVGNYTYSGNLLSAGATSTNGGVGNGAYVRFSNSSGSASTTHGVFNAGFGASITVAAGTYRFSAHSGKLSDRLPWATFDLRLITDGVAWESLALNPISKTVTVPYVAGTTAVTWAKTEVQYVIPEGHALIGEEFTWGFTAGKAAGAYFVGFDLAEVQFEAIPEPSAALLGGLGMLMLLRRRR